MANDTLTVENVMLVMKNNNWNSIDEKKLVKYMQMIPLRVLLHMTSQEVAVMAKNVFDSEREIYMQATR